MSEKDFALMAHLMRRAGFGATHEELEKRVAKGYEATVEELLHPELQPPALDDEDLLKRYHVDGNNLMGLGSCQTYWIYRMINTPAAPSRRSWPSSITGCLPRGTPSSTTPRPFSTR